MNFSEIEKIISYEFKDKCLLKKALTLSSYDNNFNNQTLEFLGDAILEFIVSEKIYGESAVNSNEGDLTKKRANIVCDNALKSVSEKLGLDKFLIKGSGDTNNQKAVPSVYEAVVGAIYLDGGMDNAKKFVYATLAWDFTEINYKGALQEFLQGRGEPHPEYRTTDNAGTPQNPYFKSTVEVFGKAFTGEGKTKSLAEQAAAQSAYNHLK